MAKRSPKAFPALYNVLQVSPRAGPAVIKAAYRALVQEVHPDHGGDQLAFQEVKEAYDVLSDPAQRAEYDRTQQVTVGKVIGNYQILKAIASGGFGTTYLGKNLLADEAVCIKHCHQVSPEYEQILLDEAKAVWDLRHYSLPVMRDLLRLEDNSLALVMSYIPGPTLEQIVKKTGPLDPETVAWITERILNALRYLHFHSVVHGDVKPQNVIVQPDSHQAVMVDFGLSMVKPTRDSEPKGYTPVFASPEQLNGSPLVPESDLYSLGMTTLFALSGSAENAMRMQVPSTVPDELCAFVKRLLLREVRKRPNWKNEDIIDTFQQVREKAFGNKRSGMKPIPGFTSSS